MKTDLISYVGDFRTTNVIESDNQFDRLIFFTEAFDKLFRLPAGCIVIQI